MVVLTICIFWMTVPLHRENDLERSQIILAIMQDPGYVYDYGGLEGDCEGFLGFFIAFLPGFGDYNRDQSILVVFIVDFCYHYCYYYFYQANLITILISIRPICSTVASAILTNLQISGQMTRLAVLVCLVSSANPMTISHRMSPIHTNLANSSLRPSPSLSISQTSSPMRAPKLMASQQNIRLSLAPLTAPKVSPTIHRSTFNSSIYCSRGKLGVERWVIRVWIDGQVVVDGCEGETRVWRYWEVT